jgi:arylsulfatase A-like enzyme
VEFHPRSPRYSPGHRKLYFGEVAYLDRQLGRLLDHLRSRGRLDSTIVALVADHGETLGERDSWFLHTGLFDETTHVPLMLRWPGAEPRGRIKGLVQHFDLFPTLLKTIGVTPDSDARLLGNAPTRDAVFANHANNKSQMLRTAGHLLIIERATRWLPQRARFFDLESDLTARRDLGGTHHPAEETLADRLAAWRASKRHTEPAEPLALDPSEQERLRASATVSRAQHDSPRRSERATSSRRAIQSLLARETLDRGIVALRIAE